MTILQQEQHSTTPLRFAPGADGSEAGPTSTTTTTTNDDTTATQDRIMRQDQSSDTIIIPETDIGRLSFYMKCVCVGCGIDFVYDKALWDFVRIDQEEKLLLQSGRLVPSSQAQQKQRVQILDLCRNIFRADCLLNQVIFLDLNHTILPLKVHNKFYRIRKPQQQGQAGDSSKSTPSTTSGTSDDEQNIMICTPQWIWEFYEQPLARLSQQARQQRMFTGPGTVTSTTRQHELLLMARVSTSLILPTLSSQEWASRWKHCGHCDGLNAACTCTFGCRRPRASHCWTRTEGGNKPTTDNATATSTNPAYPMMENPYAHGSIYDDCSSTCSSCYCDSDDECCYDEDDNEDMQEDDCKKPATTTPTTTMDESG